MKDFYYVYTVTELQMKLREFIPQYKIAKENFEFEQASILLRDIKAIKNELKRRGND